MGRMDSSVDGVVSSMDGVSIHYRVEGDGAPALVFVHCWTCDSHFWDQQVAHFAKRHRVVTLDLAGHGQSGRNREDWTMSAFGNDVRAVIEASEVDRIILIGHSMGGPVVLEAARGVPERRLVGVIPVDSLHDLSEALDTSTIDEQLQRFNRDYKAATARLVREVLFLPSSDPTLVERVVRNATSAPERIAISALRNAWAYDARQVAGELGAPIRAINTDRFPTNLKANRHLCRDYAVVIMEGLGHYPMLEDPEGFNQALEGVLRKLELRTNGG